MSKRHKLRPGDWESIVGRLQELVLANSGEDEFEEIFKLLIAKLFAEMTDDSSFAVGRSPRETAEAVSGLLAKASARWEGLLQPAELSRLTDEHLDVCVGAIQGVSLLDTHLEVMDGVFEHLVSRAQKGSKGQFFTPRHVIDCCVKIVRPRSNEFVLDPACGSAGFLAHALGYVRENESPKRAQDFLAQRLWGFDFDPRATRVARALLILAGAKNPNILRLNSLLTPTATSSLFDMPETEDMGPQLTIEDVMRQRTRSFKGFDVIITNPPFAGEVREPHILDQYVLAKGEKRVERDVLFIERCVGLLRPSGRLAMVLPHNKLASPAFSKVREWLTRQMQVVAVVGLGRNSFLPHTHQKTSIIFAVKRARPAALPTTEKILFAVSERSGKDSKGQIVERPGVASEMPLWDRADHDLHEVITMFDKHMGATAMPWENL